MTTATNSDGSVTITLQYPIRSEGEDISAITLRRPKFKEIRSIEAINGSASQLSKMLQQIAIVGDKVGLMPSAVDQLDMADIEAIKEVLELFLGKSPKTGELS